MGKYVNFNFHPAIHHLPLIQGQVAGAAALTGKQRPPSPQPLQPAPPAGSQGVPRPAERHSHIVQRPGSSPWPLARGTCPREASRRHPNQISPGCLNWLLSMRRISGLTLEYLLGGRASHPISKGEPGHPAEETHFSHLYPGSCSFNYNLYYNFNTFFCTIAAQDSFGNGKIVRDNMRERLSEKGDCILSSAESVNKDSHEISDSLNFWKGIANVGLLGEVVTKISTELLDLLNSLQLLKESVVLQNTEVAVLSNLGQVFGLLNSVKKMLVKRRQQTDPSQEEILRILCNLELQLAEQRKQQQIQALLSCPHSAKTIHTIKRQTKRPRLQKPVTTTLLTSSINHQHALTPPQFTILSPISLPSLGQPFTVADVPITSLAQSSNTVTLFPTGSQLFTRYMVTGDGKADSITFHTSSNLTLIDTSPMNDSSQLGTMVKPVELLHVSQQAVCAEAVPIEAQVLDGAMLVQQEFMQGEMDASQEHTVIEINPHSVEEGEVMALQLTGESREVIIAEKQETPCQTQERGVQELELDANGHVPDVQIVVLRENIPEENQVK
ncbi:glucocorticoid modulatory element-binding protein 1 isoform X4 [Vanacampus margaritifer]